MAYTLSWTMNFTYKQIWLINYPVMMSLLMEQLINMTDAVFLGRVGEVELGASALACMYYLAIYMLGFGFGLGIQVLVARKNGEGRLSETGEVFWQGQYFLLAQALTLCLLSGLLSPFLLRRMIASDAVWQAVADYVSWRNFGLFFAFPVLAFRSFFVGITKTKILIVNSVLMAQVNVVLNYALIFGRFGFPVLGISGAAIASSLAEGFSLLFFIFYVWKKVDRERFGLRPSFNWGVLGQLYRLSVWTMIRSFVCVIPWFYFFVMIEHLGESRLAIANIIRNVFTLFFVIMNSFATTTSALVSNLIGSGKPGQVMPLCRKVMGLSYGIGAPLVLLALLFPAAVLRVYTNEASLIAGAFWPYWVMLTNYFVAIPGYVYCNAVIGTGHTRTAFAFQLVTIAGYVVYLLLLSSFPEVPLAVFWTADHVYVLLLFLLSYLYMRKRYKQFNLSPVLYKEDI